MLMRIAVLVSGSGTNLQALLDAEARGEIPHGKISLVLSSRSEAFALERAKNHGVPTLIVKKRDFSTQDDYDAAIIKALEGAKIDFIVLAGFMQILGPKMIRRYPRRIINVHPSLIPAFCGPGFYGLKVHEEALAYGVKVSGATVHYVSEIVDGGEIISQKAIDILPDDTAESLQKRIMEKAEWILLPRACEQACQELCKGE